MCVLSQFSLYHNMSNLGGVVGGKATYYIHYSSVMSLDVTPRLITYYVPGNMGICKQICARRRERLGEGVIKWEL